MKFLRQSTGLIKEFKPIDVFSLNFAFLGPAGAVSYVLFLIHANAFLSILLATILGIPLMLNYYLLNRIIPRSTGDYVYVARAFGGIVGTISGMAVLTSFWLSMPVLASLEFMRFNLSNLDLFLITTVYIGIIYLLASKVKYYAKAVVALVAFQILGIIIMIVTNLNHAVLPTQLEINTNTLTMTALFVMMLYAFINSPSYFAGEMQKIGKSLLAGYFIAYTVTAIFAILIVIVGVNLELEIVALSALTWYLLYAMINAGATTRVMFALSFDRVLPAFLANVKGGTPTNSILLSFGIAEIFNFVENYLGFHVSLIVDDLWFIFWNYLIVAFASLKFVKEDRRILPTAVLSAIVLVFSATMVLYSSFTNLQFRSEMFTGNLYFDIATIFIPPIVGILTYVIRKMQGVQLDEIFKEIPPE
ncbi:putative amino acid transporter [Saccharolobus solfataricus rod-shaped virus 1]|uniref:Putative amino acid transporter n=1 Tax=Saccharolobus solfataricus rod-shaped virus 1 TaxID=2730619 RepID=A0A6M3VZ00_SSRV1|nr:putative amino acid transporter [Saccharolobus solfataricus rod-shaped virus 1]QJF12305.1 putative amino acid transporter [Saccharolobus solfataricus rod-shaped virus 1]